MAVNAVQGGCVRKVAAGARQLVLRVGGTDYQLDERFVIQITDAEKASAEASKQRQKQARQQNLGGEGAWTRPIGRVLLAMPRANHTELCIRGDCQGALDRQQLRDGEHTAAAGVRSGAAHALASMRTSSLATSCGTAALANTTSSS